jgi:hypothetical protein
VHALRPLLLPTSVQAAQYSFFQKSNNDRP